MNNILQLDPLQYGCDWIDEYLKHSSEVDQRDRNLCFDLN